MQSILLRCFGLLLVLGSLSCAKAAPPMEKEAADQLKVEQLVRVYPISEEEYERLLKLTDGKNAISEARLTSAGFSSVRNSLDSGWHSLLRIMGLTTTSRSVPTIDTEDQPLCVMKRNISDDAANGEDPVINCVVVVKPGLEQDPISSTTPYLAIYWDPETNTPIEQTVPQQEIQPATQAAAEVDVPVAQEELEMTTTSPVILFTLIGNNAEFKQKTSAVGPTLRQYGSPFTPLSGGGYGSSFGAYSPYGLPSQFGQPLYYPQPQYGQQLYYPQPQYGQQLYYPQQHYGQQLYYPQPYYEENEEDNDDEDEDEDEYEEADY
ncbi:uncharacterized protein LOC6560105 [Drosophila grimshawi]|uniref:GH21997 n=1 Tax=Drosophila grimshawi TaxID=7222 RepID=B4J973_DROGR|nr:uncharacterized protein LOC6560105 [Drosophila grimshawi]EDW02448.1 GH21997 [Drosophila grimshawi]